MREIITLWNASEMVFFPLLIPVSLLLLLLLRFRLLRLFRLLLLCYLHFFCYNPHECSFSAGSLNTESKIMYATGMPQ